jgi:hypothetical protein
MTHIKQLGAHICDEILIEASLYDHRATCINTSYDSYLLAPDRSRMLEVVNVDVRLHYYNSLLPSTYKKGCLAFDTEKVAHDVTIKQEIKT